MTIYPGGHHRKSGKCHPLLGRPVVIMDVKERRDLPLIGRTGVIHHDPTFDHDYLSFDDGGSVDPAKVIVDELVDHPARQPSPEAQP